MRAETTIDEGHAEKLSEWKVYIIPLAIGLVIIAAFIAFIYFSHYTIGGNIK